MADAACGDCKFWVIDAEEPRKGECRVEPPKIDKDRDGVWPLTFRDDWCGRFTNKTRPTFV